MSEEKSYTSLVTAGDPYWRSKYSALLITEGLDVHTASDRAAATDLLRKHKYEVVVADSSIGEPELLEFALTLQDMKTPMPVTLIAEEESTKHLRLWKRIDIFFVGERPAVASKIGDAVSQARGKGGADSQE
jgi:DNA-binding NtrC family response regulator